MANRRLNRAQHQRLINEMRRHWMHPHSWKETQQYGKELYQKIKQEKEK